MHYLVIRKSYHPLYKEVHLRYFMLSFPVSAENSALALLFMATACIFLNLAGGSGAQTACSFFSRRVFCPGHGQIRKTLAITSTCNRYRYGFTMNGNRTFTNVWIIRVGDRCLSHWSQYFYQGLVTFLPSKLFEKAPCWKRCISLSFFMHR